MSDEDSLGFSVKERVGILLTLLRERQAAEKRGDEALAKQLKQREELEFQAAEREISLMREKEGL